MWDKLKDRLAHFPKSPGVYLMYGPANKIIYIGKAKNLHARLRQYFSGADKRNFVKLFWPISFCLCPEANTSGH
jgi:excinuclease UvrABC nuclease subunit